MMSKQTYIGHRTWAIPGCCIPAESTGDEPVNTSRDEISILNTGGSVVSITITIYYADREPAGPYRISVDAERSRSIRFNDLIDPEAILLQKEFAVLLQSDKPIVVQFNRLDTANGGRNHSTTMAFPIT
ncbi:sensory rhodopsin transducer [Sphingobacterium chuzhouense]|nr:sensory rhodopsin transducer [Sphingobacterium chuzhouense]